MKNIVAYCRTASDFEDCSSIKRQARAIKRAAGKRGIKIKKFYMDPAQSGVSLNRPALKELLAECEAGNIRTVVVRDLSRFARDVTLINKILLKFFETGVRIEFSTQHGKMDFRFQQLIWGAAAEYTKTRV